MATNKQNIFLRMITSHAGEISSKIIIGTLGYLALLVAIIVLMFTNPGFPSLSDMVTMLIITSASLLGLTTVENIRQKPQNRKPRDLEEEPEEDEEYYGDK